MSTIAENQVGCQDLGILAIPMRALGDFEPAFVEATPTNPAHVTAVCPVCLEPPGEGLAAGGVRVGMSTSKPKFLTWYCFSHGGSSGILSALEARTVQKSDLGIGSKKSIRKADIDPVAHHQDSVRCTSPRRITHYSSKLRQARSTLMPCKRCEGCRAWRKVHRIGQLKDKVSEWTSVQRTGELSPEKYAALSRRLRHELEDTRKRHETDPSVKVTGDYVGVPTTCGRIVLTNSAHRVGDVIATSHEGEDTIRNGDIELSIEALIGAMLDDGRISASRKLRDEEEDKKEKKKEKEWERVGPHTLDAAHEAAVYARFGCPRVLQEGRAARNVAPRWDLSSLCDDERLALWVGLGIRVWGSQ